MSSGLLDSRPKNPTKVKAGKAGMAARWAGHIPLAVRLDDLDLAQRRLVVALINAAKEAAAAREEAAPAIVSPGAAESEGHGNVRPTD